MTSPPSTPLGGVGIGWRRELAGFVARHQGLGFVEVVAESLHPDRRCRRAWPSCGGEGCRWSPTGSGCRWARPTSPTPPAVLELVTELCERRDPPGVMLERDDDYPPAPELAAELEAIAAAVAGAARR
jgi:hypothetical protein